MSQQVRRWIEKTLDYQENSQVFEELPVGWFYRYLAIQLSGTVSVGAGGDNDANDIASGDEWELIDLLEIKRNESETLMSISGPELKMLNFFQHKAVPPLSPELGDGATTTIDFESYLILPFTATNMAIPFDSALNTNQDGWNSFDIILHWNDENAIFTHTNATGFATDPTVRLYSAKSIGYNGPPLDVKKFRQSQEADIPNTDDHEINLREQSAYRGFLLHMENNGLDDPLADTIDNIDLVSGDNDFQEREMREQVEVYRVRNGLTPNDLTLARSSNFDIDAWSYLEHPTDGLLSETIDAEGLADFEMVLDTSQSGRDLTVVRETYDLATNIAKGAQ